MPAYLFSSLRLSFVIARDNEELKIRRSAARKQADDYTHNRLFARGAVTSEVMPEGMLENMTEKCAHKICSCPARADTGYCGGYCMTASKDPDAGIVCGCGHPECKPGDIPMPTQSP